eukprot:225101-Chlamydomonas_euryale.AAC.11
MHVVSAEGCLLMHTCWVLHGRVAWEECTTTSLASAIIRSRFSTENASPKMVELTEYLLGDYVHELVGRGVALLCEAPDGVRQLLGREKRKDVIFVRTLRVGRHLQPLQVQLWGRGSEGCTSGCVDKKSWLQPHWLDESWLGWYEVGGAARRPYQQLRRQQLVYSCRVLCVEAGKIAGRTRSYVVAATPTAQITSSSTRAATYLVGELLRSHSRPAKGANVGTMSYGQVQQPSPLT